MWIQNIISTWGSQHLNVVKEKSVCDKYDDYPYFGGYVLFKIIYKAV